MYPMALTAGETARGLTDILQDAGEVVESIVGWVPKVAQLVISEPVLLIPFTIGIATLAFGIFKGLRH